MRSYIACLYAFLACFAFSVVFEEKRFKIMLTSALTGSAAWFVYLLLRFLGGGIKMQTVRYLLAAIAVALLSEIFARLLKTPTTVFLTIGIIPLVPGAGIYYTMKNLIAGDLHSFTLRGIETIACAGAIAIGCSLVASVARIIRENKKRKTAAKQ